MGVDDKVPAGRLRRLLAGLVAGLAVAVAALVALSLSRPLPEALPGLGGVTVHVAPVAVAPAASPAPVAPAPAVEAPASDPTAGAPAPDPTPALDLAPAPEPAASGEIALIPRSEAATTVPAAAQAALAGLGGQAGTRNATAFQPVDAAPLIAVVLDDASAAGFGVEALVALGLPVTLGIVAGRGGDVTLARAARAAGLEVLAQLPVGAVEPQGLLPGMAPDEVAARTATMLARLDLAVAAAPRGAVAGDAAALLAGLRAQMARHGFADATGGGALLAAEVAIPAGVTADQAYGLLDRGAREAQARGQAVVLGPASQPMLEALLRWGLERGGRAARLAPLSAVLTRRAAE